MIDELGLRKNDLVILRRGGTITRSRSFGEVSRVGYDICGDFPEEVAADVMWLGEGMTSHPVDDLEKIYGAGEDARERHGRMILLDHAEGIVLTAERHRASAESYAFGSQSGSSAREALKVAQARWRKARMYVHYAHVLADGLLPECGHPVSSSQQAAGMWWCFDPEHADEEYPMRLDTTNYLLMGV